MRTKDAINIFLTSRRASGVSPETLRWYKDIFRFFESNNYDLPEQPEPIMQFLANCTAGDERRHGYYRALRAMYNYMDLRLHAYPNPMKFVVQPKRTKKVPRPLMPEELDQLISYPHEPKMKAAIMFLIDTGCRVGELANLKLNDITKSPWGYMARVSGKTGTRLVPISSETYNALIRVMPLGYSRYRLRRKISMAFDEARVKGSSINLRHTFGTYWEGDESILQHIMGHTHFETTQIYRQLRFQRITEQHRQYSPLKMIMGGTKSFDL